MDEEEYRKVKGYALRRLGIKAYLSKELEKALEKKEFAPEFIKRAIEECRQLGYLNDEEWLDSFIRGQISKKRGPQSIISKLYQKGISKEKIDLLMSTIAIPQRDQIRKLLSSKYKNKNLKDFKEKQKVIASLVRRGYSIREICAELKVEENVTSDSF